MKKMENFEKSLKKIEMLEKFVKLVKEDIQIVLEIDSQYEELDYTDWIFYLKDAEEFEMTKGEVISLAKFMTAE